MDKKQIKRDAKTAQFTKDLEVLRSLAASPSAHIRWAAANNVIADSELLLQLSSDVDESVQTVALRRLSYLQKSGQVSSSQEPGAEISFSGAPNQLQSALQAQDRNLSGRLGFAESDGLWRLRLWGFFFVSVGAISTFFGLVGMLVGSGYSSTPPIAALVALAVGIAFLNNGVLFLILYALGEGIAFRIGRHLSNVMARRDANE